MKAAIRGKMEGSMVSITVYCHFCGAGKSVEHSEGWIMPPARSFKPFRNLHGIDPDGSLMEFWDVGTNSGLIRFVCPSCWSKLAKRINETLDEMKEGR